MANLREVIIQPYRTIDGKTKELASFIFDLPSPLGARHILTIPREEEYIAYDGQIFSVSIGHIETPRRVLGVKKLLNPKTHQYPLVVIETEIVNNHAYQDYFLAKIEKAKLIEIFAFNNCYFFSPTDSKICEKLCSIVGAQGMCLFSHLYEGDKLFLLKDGELILINNGLLSVNSRYLKENKGCIGKRRKPISRIRIGRIYNDRIVAGAKVPDDARVLIDLEMLKHDGVAKFYNSQLYLNWAP